MALVFNDELFGALVVCIAELATLVSEATADAAAELGSPSALSVGAAEPPSTLPVAAALASAGAVVAAAAAPGAAATRLEKSAALNGTIVWHVPPVEVSSSDAVPKGKPSGVERENIPPTQHAGEPSGSVAGLPGQQRLSCTKVLPLGALHWGGVSGWGKGGGGTHVLGGCLGEGEGQGEEGEEG